MKIGNFGHELAELRAAQERDAGIAKATAAVKQAGSDDCADCGETIDTERRKAAPFATRCITCQQIFEKDLRRSA